MFTKSTLKNGLRIILAPTKGTKTVTVLLMVGTGSKYETKDINGISHFLEHMFFQGTKKRPSILDVAGELDQIGAVYNAFTGKEYTGYWVKSASKHFDLVLDILSDILLNASLDPQEIEREKKVIIEEINMHQDIPQHQVAMIFEELLYGDQPTGWRILGTKEIVKNLSRQQIFKYRKEQYVASNIVMVIAGNLSKVQSSKLKVKSYFGKIKAGKSKSKKKVIEKQSNPQTRISYRKTDQSHFCLGVRAYNLFDPRRYALNLLDVILGGNMSSRLHFLIRKEGLAYYIDTDSEFYTDCGYFVAQAGVNNRRVEKAIKLILKEYKKISEEKVSDKELTKAKECIKGRTLISLESSDGIASWLCTQELLRGKISNIKEEFAKIDRVTSKDIQEIARDIFRPEKLNLALVGPFRDKKQFNNILTI